MSKNFKLAKKVVDKLSSINLMLTSAESCTGGQFASTIIDIPGSSKIFDRGFITYHDKSKIEILGVPEKLIKTHGAVSEEVAMAMAEGALKKSNASISVSCTGIAGPSGGTKIKPVGLIYIGIIYEQNKFYLKKNFGNIGRSLIRELTTKSILKLILDLHL
ncbi:MAG: damage-inducible protein CinA [Rhodospirillaceae bacterium]|nr:damage-inducible protein CinA [Rhodospirillaceae bacterium]|tara:strand:+ start:24978 stop:25460 length:483 start_codon:yes stop_codon:yes gene_type:complete